MRADQMMNPSRSRRAMMAAALLLTMMTWSAPVWAFCGFYVSGATGELSNGATQVVLMRHEKTTVQSMQNSYEGPPEDFAMVVPVPVVLQKDQVKTLAPDVFKKIDQLGAPRLVEYWEQDPCEQRELAKGNMMFGAGIGSVSGYGRGGMGGVQVMAQFEVGEYEIVILSAKESGGLETWLRANKYNIPKGAAKVLKPYVQQGMYFFVAKVNLKKLKKDEAGRFTLSPLRFHYQSDEFTLPVRLGLLNAKGKQDLIVHILAQNQRYEVANTRNVTIPTNIVVNDSTRKRFGQFYATLFDRVTEENPGAVVTEYAWDASTCDPCPGPTLDSTDYMTFGADVTHNISQSSGTTAKSMLVTKLPEQSANVDPKIATRVMRQHNSAVRACHQQQLTKNPGLPGGTITASLAISKEGNVQTVTLKEDTIKDAELAACITKRLQRVRFPVTKDGAVSEVSQSFMFGKGVMVAQRRGIGGAGRGWTLTRLHARYDAKTLRDDLVFKKAKPLVGGRGMPRGVEGTLGEQTGKLSDVNNFQGRYVILNRWKGKLACKQPLRGVWGGPIDDREETTTPATNLAFIGRAPSLKPFTPQKRVAGLRSMSSKQKGK